MPIIIGGPPSSGSSLLSVILNRHSKIACIQETHLLAKESLYVNWGGEKIKIKKGRLHSPGWHQYSKVELPVYNWDKFDAVLDSTSSVSEFSDLYFSALATVQDKEIWAEKTPANVYFFHQLAKGIKDSQFLLTIRHPYDIIASLIQRGKSKLDAVSLCLLNMGIGYVQSKNLNVRVIKYENLVLSTKNCITELCGHLNIDFEHQMLDAATKPSVKMKGWNHYEDGPIANNSINRFDELDQERKDQIMELCENILINKSHLIKYNIPFAESISNDININYLIKQYGYQSKTSALSKQKKPLFITDKLSRLIKSHPSSHPYPIIYQKATTT